MPTIIINATTQPSGISYDWDRDYDIKTVAGAQEKYLSLRAQLAGIPKAMAKMEALAAADGFPLPTEDFAALVEQLAGELLRANPGKMLRLLPAADSYGHLSFGVPLILPNQLWLESEQESEEENVGPALAPEVLVNAEGLPWSTSTLHSLAEAHELLVSGKYQILTLAELEASLPE